MKDGFGVERSEISKAYYEEHDPVIQAINRAKGSAFGVGAATGATADHRIKKSYSDDIDASLRHRRQATRRIKGAEVAETTGAVAGTGAFLISSNKRQQVGTKVANKVLQKPYSKANMRRGIAQWEGDAKAAAKWGRRERMIVRAARAAAHPVALPAALVAGGVGTGVGLRIAAARHNAKSNAIARSNNKSKDRKAKIAIVGLGTKTVY